MLIPSFDDGRFVRFTSRRTGELMLEVRRVRRDLFLDGMTPRDDVAVWRRGRSLEVVGLIYDSEGLALSLPGHGKEQIHAEVMMEEDAASGTVKRYLFTTDHRKYIAG